MLLKWVETSVFQIIFNGILCQISTYTVTISYRLLNMSQVPEKFHWAHDQITLQLIWRLY